MPKQRRAYADAKRKSDPYRAFLWRWCHATTRRTPPPRGRYATHAQPFTATRILWWTRGHHDARSAARRHAMRRRRSRWLPRRRDATAIRHDTCDAHYAACAIWATDTPIRAIICCDTPNTIRAISLLLAPISTIFHWIIIYYHQPNGHHAIQYGQYHGRHRHQLLLCYYFYRFHYYIIINFIITCWACLLLSIIIASRQYAYGQCYYYRFTNINN